MGLTLACIDHNWLLHDLSTILPVLVYRSSWDTLFTVQMYILTPDTAILCMDDLWGNAWNEPVKTETTDVKKDHAEDSWASPNTNAGLNIPSWTTSTVRWDDHSISTSSTWLGNGLSSSVDDGWGASPPEDVNETREQDEVASTPLKSPVLESTIDEGYAKEADTKTLSPPESPVVQTAAHEAVSTPIPPSSERFGTSSPNHSLTVATPKEWAPVVTSPVATNTDWVSPWGGAVAGPELQSHTTASNQSEGPVDEWERAAQEKQIRDTKMVSPYRMPENKMQTLSLFTSLLRSWPL